MFQSQFLSDQALYLRPDPTRFVVRPFKPATEPRDLNPTVKTRANHIVGRALRLEGGAAERQLTDILDQIILPYAISDTFSTFATIKIAALMQAVAI